MEIGDRIPVSVFIAAVEGTERFALSEAALTRIAAARRVIDRYARGDEPVYGLNTGLGANLAHRIPPEDIPDFQAQLLRGRAVAVGPSMDARTGRAALLVRVIGAARGASGLSQPVIDLMLAMLNTGLAPVIPMHGSIGAGDLTLAAHMGLTLIGEGDIWRNGERIGAAEALRDAGLTPVTLAPKDALALANHSAISVALTADVVMRAKRLMRLAKGAAVLAGEGYAINLSIFDADVHALRPATGQEEAAAWFRAAFAGSSLETDLPRAIQDALSFRTMASVFGTVEVALARLEAEVEIELNAGADNPAVIGGATLSTPNFQTPAIALALDTMAISVTHVAAAAAQRIVKLMAPQLSGLPKYLSPVGGGSAGFVPMQKTVAALLGEINRHAASGSLSAMPVSDMVEDVAPQTPLCSRKLSEQLDAWRLLIGIEAMVAAQAVDLRQSAALGKVAGTLHAAIRASVSMLTDDRPTGPDVACVLSAIEPINIA